MNKRRYVQILGATAVVLLGGSVRAEATTDAGRTITSRAAVDAAVQGNPSLRAALVSEERAQAAIRAEEGLYPYVFEADTGYTHSSSPLGRSMYRKTDQVSVGAGISKSFAVGTSAEFRLDGDWYQTDNSSSLDTTEASSVPNFGLGARLTLTQPLLRGFGKTVGLSSLRIARKEKTAAEKSTDASASALAKEVLDTYWSLWLAATTVEINRKSRDIAAAQLQETEERVAVGDAAPVDKLAYQTRLASLEETVIESESEVRRLQVLLASRIGAVDRGALPIADTAEEPAADTEVETPEALLKRALSESPSIHEAFAAVSSAEEKVKVAGESLRQRLDFTAWLEARTLAVDEVSPVITDFGDGGAYSGYVGLTYELPLDNRRKEAERAQARLGVEIATQNLKSVENQVRADLLTAYENLLAAEKRLSMAEETLSLAEAEAEAERERYRLGAAIFTTVRDAEETVREAELRLTRARVDIVQAGIALDHLTGDLLQRIVLER